MPIFNNIKGFPSVFWYFFVATFINKAGALMMPFLSRFLNIDCHFSLSDTGWIFFFLGLGTVCGTFASGWFIDKFGAYKVILISLISSAILLVLLALVVDFQLFCLIIFIFSFNADMLRPSILITLNSFTNKSNRVQCFTLIRSASNLGLIIGPLIGSFLILNNSKNFRFLFIIDALTCVIAAVIIGVLIHEKKLKYKLSSNLNSVFKLKFAAFKDNIFILNNIVACISGILFFQFFSVFPLYYSNANFQHFFKVDYLISILAFVIAIFEIWIVNYYIARKYVNNLAIGAGMVFFIIGYLE